MNCSWSVRSETRSVLLCLVVFALGCRGQGEPEILFGIDGCAACGMVIDNPEEASGYYLERQFHAFCSAGCLLNDFEERRKTGQDLPQRIYFSDYSEGGLAPAAAMTFLLSDRLPSVMDWGILAFEDSATASQNRQQEEEMLTDWLGVRRLRGKPDRTVVVEISVDAMAPPEIELAKGELVVWEVRGTRLESSLPVQIRGYEELGDVVVPAGGETSVRFLATRPGDGFPVQRATDSAVLGRIRVIGPHTADEEEW